MGARQSKRSVDITTTPKKEGIPVEGGVVGDAAAPGDGKLERIEEADTKPTTNGIAPHTDTSDDKEKDKDETTEKDKEQQPQQEEVKAEETKQESSGESPAEVAEVTTPTEATPASPNTATSPDNKEGKKKDKKKKWSFRSISFSKKDKTKPSREEAPKNGDVTKEEPLAEGGEDAENATAATSSPEEKSAASSPSADEQVAAPVAAAEPKEESNTALPAAAASPVDEKKEEPTPSAPTPVPSVEDKKEETVEKVEAEKKVVEVSQSAGGQSVTDPVEIPVRVQPVATPSIIERKTSEDPPSLLPSSPPPTPIDPSPLQQARQAAASATALTEALKLPAVAADEEESMPTSPLDASCDDVPQEIRESSVPTIASPTSFGSSADLPPTETTFVLAKVECSPVVDAKIKIEIETSQDVAKMVGKTLASTCDNKEVEIESKVESMLESSVTKEVSKCQKSEANKVKEASPLPEVERDTRKQLIELVDNKTMQNEDVVESKTEFPFISKEIDPFINSSVRKSDSLDQCPINISNEKLPEVTVFSTVEEVSDIVAKVMNEPLVVECQIKSEINNCEGDMKINELPSTDSNEVEIGTLPSIENESKDAYPTIEQHLSSTNLEIEKMECPSETMQHVESMKKLSDSDLPSIDKCVAVESKISSKAISTPSKIENSLKEEPKQSSDAKIEEHLSERPIEYEHDYAKYAPEEERIASITLPTELFINSEEGPLSVSEDIVVEAKPAMIIPEDDSVEELSDTTESIKVILDTDEEKIENETESDTALPTKETLISEEDMSAPEDVTGEPLNEIINMSDNIIKNEIKITDIEDTLPAPPENLQASTNPQIYELQDIANETEHIVNREVSIAISASGIETETFVTSPSQIEQTKQVEKCLLLPKDCTSSECCSLQDSKYSPQIAFSDFSSVSKRHSPTRVLSPGLENMPISLEDLPPAPEDTGMQSLDSFDYPLPPEELSCPLSLIVTPNVSTNKLPPAPVEHAASPRDPTETLLTPPISPNFQSNANIASGIATETSTRDCSQIPLYDDISNREQPASLSEPMILYNQSDIELKQRLAAECLAKTESQEEALLSCELSNTVPSTVSKEHHQKAPEVEAPVENNVAHDDSTTESADEAPKVAPPAIPTEAPASPPTAPAITEDVASVTKAIEEIDISDKAVAAAVNEAIECNTNEIIADAHHQNNINE
ncbi:A-kinase anchor protein 200 [Polyergus mexicanus]|uniref:A-kinase anchor protein 200 n=1 Tax=Polyergus mexicanus TaxID=615972 RepID=UPI0038B41DA7